MLVKLVFFDVLISYLFVLPGIIVLIFNIRYRINSEDKIYKLVPKIILNIIKNKLKIGNQENYNQDEMNEIIKYNSLFKDLNEKVEGIGKSIVEEIINADNILNYLDQLEEKIKLYKESDQQELRYKQLEKIKEYIISVKFKLFNHCIILAFEVIK